MENRFDLPDFLFIIHIFWELDKVNFQKLADGERKSACIFAKSVLYGFPGGLPPAATFCGGINRQILSAD